MTVEPHTASVKLMQIQSDTQGHQEERGIAVQIRRPFCPGAARCRSLAQVGEIRDPNPLLLLGPPASRLRLARALCDSLSVLHIKSPLTKSQPFIWCCTRETEFWPFVIFVSLKP